MHKNIPAKFIRKIGEMKSKNNSKHDFEVCTDGEKYELSKSISKHKIGDQVIIAKLRNNPSYYNYTWDLYLIELPRHGDKSISNMPQSWFGYNSLVIQKSS